MEETKLKDKTKVSKAREIPFDFKVYALISSIPACVLKDNRNRIMLKGQTKARSVHGRPRASTHGSLSRAAVRVLQRTELAALQLGQTPRGVAFCVHQRARALDMKYHMEYGMAETGLPLTYQLILMHACGFLGGRE